MDETAGKKLDRLVRGETLPTGIEKTDTTTKPKTTLQKMLEGKFPIKETGSVEQDTRTAEKRKGGWMSWAKKQEEHSSSK